MTDAFRRPRRIALLGGSSEIGQAIATQLVERGGVQSIALAGRRPAEAPALAGARIEHVQYDALQPSTHGAAVDALFADGDLDLVIVAAGLLGSTEDERDATQVRDVVTTNFAGIAPVLADVAWRLAAQGHGTIVVLSSVAAQRPRRSNYVYGASKAGLDAFSRGLQLALAGTGVRLLLVRPGFVKTKMTAGLPPLPLATTPDAVARIVVQALDDEKDVVWAPGLFRYVMWAVRLLPNSIVRRM